MWNSLTVQNSKSRKWKQNIIELELLNLHYTKLTITSVDDTGTYISNVLRQHSTPTTQKCLCITKFWFLTSHNNTFLFNVLPSTVTALLLNPNYWTEQQQNTKTLQVIYTSSVPEISRLSFLLLNMCEIFNNQLLTSFHPSCEVTNKPNASQIC